MYLMYVDESGDCGTENSPTRYFVLTAIVFHELRWRPILQSMVDFRKMLKETKGLKLRDEIHCTHFINKPGDLIRIKRNDRLDIMKKCIDWANAQTDLSTFSIVVDKQGRKDEIFELAWNALLMRFENTIRHKNFPSPQNADDRGIVLSDNTEGEKLRGLIRKMRHYNTIPNRQDMYQGGYKNVKLEYIIEDPIFRDSQYSFIHQLNDVIAYCVRQKYEPNSYMKKKAGTNFYNRLSNVTVKVVSKSNDGIVEL
jgi:hypothetical protein